MTTTDVELTTGWGAGVAVGDTMLRRFLNHHAASNAAFAGAAGGRVVTSDILSMSDFGRPGGYFNAAVLLAPPPAGEVAGLLDQIEAFASAGSGEFGIWSAWDLGDLSDRGWELSGHPPLLIRPPSNVMAAPAPPEVDVRPVSSPADLEAWEQVVIEGYPMPELAGAPAGALADPRILSDDRVTFWVGYRNGQPVSVGTLFEAHGLAGLALGVTLPAARHQGFWLRHAVDRLTAVPDLWTAGVFSDMSRPGAEKLGFVPICRLTLWTTRTTRRDQ